MNDSRFGRFFGESLLTRQDKIKYFLSEKTIASVCRTIHVTKTLQLFWTVITSYSAVVILIPWMYAIFNSVLAIWYGTLQKPDKAFMNSESLCSAYTTPVIGEKNGFDISVSFLPVTAAFIKTAKPESWLSWRERRLRKLWPFTACRIKHYVKRAWNDFSQKT